MEKTLVLIKPDAVKRKLMGEIISVYEKSTLHIKSMKIIKATNEIAKEHYEEHKEKPFFHELIDYITSGEMCALIIEGDNAVEEVRKLNGATDPKEADPSSIRGKYALSKSENCVHASDSIESAEREIKIWFPETIVAPFTLNHVGTIAHATDRLILRRFTNDDVEAVYNNWTSDSELNKYMKRQHHKSIEETKFKINDWVNRYEHKNFYQWAITFKDKDEPIGVIGLSVINESDMCGNFNYVISKKYSGMGLTSEALKTVLKFAFETVGFNRIESYHSVNNPASGKVMIKAGMTLEGLARQKYRSNGGFEDSYMYSIIKEDFK